MYFKRTNIYVFDITRYGHIVDTFTKKNWLKEKNLYKFRREKKFLASRRT
jgi:hypothetical protein